MGNNVDKTSATEAGTERAERPVESLELNGGVKTARWKQETANGKYFHKTSYKTFYTENAENEEEDPKYVDTIWFGAHQSEEVLKGVQNWNQRTRLNLRKKISMLNQ